MGIHEKMFDEYLIEKLFEDFRNYDLINKNFIRELSKSKYSDKFRSHIDRDDIEQIIDLIETDEDPEVRFGHLLIRSLLSKEEAILKPLLLDLYENSKNTINKIGLIFDLLEFPDVAFHKSKIFYSFLEANREQFETYEMDWYENEENLISSIESRLTSYRKNPKKWMYLYLLSLVKFNKQKAKKIIDEYFQETDEFTIRIRNKVEEYLKFNKIKLGDFYLESYSLARKIINSHLSNNSNVLDIGCGNAPYLEDHLHNTNSKFILIDKEKYIFESPHTFFYQFDINNVDIIKWARSLCVQIDFIVINATLHELWTGDKKVDYFQSLLNDLINLINVGGKIYIGDYYYNSNVTEDQFNEYAKSLLENVGHADAINRFYHPSELLFVILKKNNLKIIEFSEIRVSNIIERFFYGFLIEKESEVDEN